MAGHRLSMGLLAALLLQAVAPLAHAALTPTSSALTMWLSMLQNHIRLTPPMSHMQAAKYYAGMSLAAYNALNSNRGQLDERAVVASACHTYLDHFFPQRYADHDVMIRNQLQDWGVPEDIWQQASALGQKTANKLIASRVGDGFDKLADWQAPVDPAPGVWRLLTAAQGDDHPEFPQWGYVKPYIMNEKDVRKVTARSVESYEQNLLSTYPDDQGQPYLWSQQYYDDVNVTYTTGGQSSPPSMLPSFWADGNAPPSGTSTAPGHFITISMQVLPDDLSLYDQARFFAALTATIFDATIPCFRIKYTVNLWRPYSAIIEGDPDNTYAADPTWKPVMKVPPHPSYPSGHSCISSAAVEVLKAWMGNDECDLVVSSEGNNQTIHFTSFTDMCTSAGDSRVLAGLHYHNDCLAGMNVGKDVARITLRKLKIIKNHNWRRQF